MLILKLPTDRYQELADFLTERTVTMNLSWSQRRSSRAHRRTWAG